MKKHEHLTWVSNFYWWLDEVSCVLVLRNKLWFATASPILENLWTTIIKERKEGFAHRAPKKKLKTERQSPILGPSQCYIDTEALGAKTSNSITSCADDNIVISISTQCQDDTYLQEP